MGKRAAVILVLSLTCASSWIFGTKRERDLEQGVSWSAFPILMYDVDIGWGYGAKAKIVGGLRQKESFDLLVFNSSKGERTYGLTFSMPDFEVRQGTAYGLSLDLKAEYSKYLKQYFFGLGPDSSKADLTFYTDEKKELSLTLGRGFSPEFVGELRYVLRSVRFFNVEPERPFTEMLETVGEVFSPYAGFQVRIDTTDSRIHPRRGVRLILQADAAGSWMGNSEASYFRYGLDIRAFRILRGHGDVLAVRALVQKIAGADIPLFELLTIGGGSEFSALRGYRLNRFRGRGKLLLNAEYRFPLWKKLGGNLFVDAGQVWPGWRRIRLKGWAADAGWGLRYYLKNFVVRFDMGISTEGTGIYFNFDHVF